MLFALFYSIKEPILQRAQSKKVHKGEILHPSGRLVGFFKESKIRLEM